MNGSVIANHGYVDISDIGSTDDSTLLCHTNCPPPPGISNSNGDWFGPNWARVGDPYGGYYNVPGLVRNRAPMIVRLIRNVNTGDPAEGIYQCKVKDSAETLRTLSVGLYNSGGGNNVLAHL